MVAAAPAPAAATKRVRRIKAPSLAGRNAPRQGSLAPAHPMSNPTGTSLGSRRHVNARTLHGHFRFRRVLRHESSESDRVLSLV